MKWPRIFNRKPNIAKMVGEQDFEGLAKACHHEDFSVVQKAVQALFGLVKINEKLAEFGRQTMDLKGAVEPLIGIARGVVWDFRRPAIEALGKTGDAGAVQPLISLLNDEDLGWVAATALAAIGEPAVEPLIQLLEDEDLDMCSKAAVALGEIGDARAVEPLIETLDDPNFDLRSKAADALGKIRDARAIGPLIETLKDDSWVRKSGLSITVWDHWATSALGEMGKPASKPLIKVLKHGDGREREWAIVALGKIGPEAKAAVPALIKALEDKDEDVRSNAIVALGKIGPEAKAAVPALIEAWEDDDCDICKKVAAHALGLIGDTRAVKSLKQALESKGMELFEVTVKQALDNIERRKAEYNSE